MKCIKCDELKVNINQEGYWCIKCGQLDSRLIEEDNKK
jgi:hypothetical protein